MLDQKGVFLLIAVRSSLRLQESLDRKSQLALLPHGEELGALGLLTVAYFVADELFGTEIFPYINVIGSLIFSGILFLACWNMIKVDGRNIWTALFWLRLSSATYFGLGTTAVYFL